mgnify:CR=1 FL=1
MNTNQESKIILITGSRGSGKTATALSMAETTHKENPSINIYMVAYPQPKLLPTWFHHVKKAEEAPNNSLLIIDEAALEYGARQSMSKKSKGLAAVLPILRHKDQSAIFITQNTGLSDVNLVRLVDSIIIKKPSFLQSKTDRSAIKPLLEKASIMLKGKDKSYSYTIDGDEEKLLQINLPSFWNNKIGKAWSKPIEEQEENDEEDYELEPMTATKPLRTKQGFITGAINELTNSFTDLKIAFNEIRGKN